MERARGGMTSYALSLPLPPRTSAEWSPTCASVTVNEARRYLTTSINTHEILFQNLKTDLSIDDSVLQMNFKGLVREDVDWIYLAHDRDQWTR
jgi:hypothetical protein